VPTQKYARSAQAAHFLITVLLVAGCTPWRALEPTTSNTSTPSTEPAPSAPAQPAATKSEPASPSQIAPPRPTRKLIVIQAKVDSRRRIVAGTTSGLVMSAEVEALARELAPQGILSRGTEINAVYETHDARGSRSAVRQLVAIRVGSGPDARVAVLSPAEDGQMPQRAYSLDGRPVGTDFLRYPIAHLRITSGFTASRKHPISKKHKPHLAVDFAAPYGTPVVAVADGEVVHAKWVGGYGRLVRIQHDGEYASAYAHLQRYATGIKAGTRVTKGQIIGYVGNSGMATGPHLHYVLLRGDVPIDPLGAGVPTPPRLAGEALVALHGQATHVEQILAAADREDSSATRLASAKR
jgi:murein DD-endopeptidase MepM/ murein hydrolase activator NlpD